MRNKLRALVLLCSFPFRIDAVRSAAGMVLIVVSQASTIAAAYALKIVTNGVVERHGSDTRTGIVVLAVSVVVTVGGAWAGFIVRAGMTDRTLLAVDAELATLCSSIVGTEHYERPEFLDRIQEISENRQNLAGMPNILAVILAVGLRLLLTVIVLASTKPILGLVPLLLVPPVTLTILGRGWYNRAWDRIWPLWRMQLAIFAIGSTEPGGREIRTYGIQEEIRRRHKATFDESDQMLADVQLRISLSEAGGWALFGLGFTLALVIIARSALHGGLSAGDLVLIVALATQLNAQVGLLATSLGSTSGSFKTAEHFAWLVDYANRQGEVQTQPLPSPARITRGIELSDVSFSYPGTSGQALDHVSLRLSAGSTVAIVGENGAGKSTIVKLLLRMYEPDSGQILVDGVDLATVDPREWRRHVSAAFQDFARPEFTAGQVVGLGELERMEFEPALLAALDRARATDVVETLPNGLSTQLGRLFSDGRELSGGQWQKLALARAMMRDRPLLLVLDEPTASLDALVEAQLFERYAAAARESAAVSGAITVLVSHRFSTVRLADTIVVLDGGHVVEAGSHQELLALGGVYAELYELQARAYR